MINEARLSKALTYLAESDATIAEFQTTVERLEYRAKAIRDARFLLEEGSVAERTAKAGTHPDYEIAMNGYFTALQEFLAMKNKRSTESIVVDVWRSLNSSRNKGNIT
jgi:hypothetical protein